MSENIKVAVIDDHSVVRIGLRYVLQLAGELTLAGERATGEGAVAFLKDCGADVALLDLRMPGLDGLDVLKEIRASGLKVKVLMLTTSDTEADIAQSIKAGADGYVLKDCEPEKLIGAIRAVAAGGTFFPEEVARLYQQHLSAPGLSPRETEILTLVAKGLSNTAIAQLLDISGETVKMHIKHIFEKLDVTDRVEAVTMAISRGFIKV